MICILSKSQWALIGIILTLTLSCDSPKTGEVASGIPDGGFEQGGLEDWAPDNASPEFSYSLEKGKAHTGKISLFLSSSQESPEAHSLSRIVSGPLPNLGFVKLTGWVKTTGRAEISLQPQAEGKRSGARSFIPVESLPHDGKWNKLEAKVYIPLKTDSLKVSCAVLGKGEAAYDDLTLETIPREPGIVAFLTGPSIACAQGAEDFKAAKDLDKFEVVFPLPNITDYQTPISFDLKADPPEKLISSAIFHRAGDNWNCRVVLGPIKKDGIVKLRYSLDVIVSAADYSKIPEKITIPPASEYPKEILPWLEPTAAVQSTHPKIVEAAKKLMAETSGQDTVAFLKKMLPFLRTIPFKPDGKGCDALSMLEYGGFCTSHANLAAALCRAVGIPARVIACYPNSNIPLQTHYIIEAYLPGVGWIPCESTARFYAVQPFLFTFMSHVEIQDEKDSFESNRYAAGGVPKWSLNEYDATTELMMVNEPLKEAGCDHIAFPKVQYPEKAIMTDLILKGSRIWGTYLKAKTGQAAAPELVAVMDKEITNAPTTPEALLDYLAKLEKLCP